jgi:serine/threonine protein kinase/tetratricopeptide (TPR) repeat protein
MAEAAATSPDSLAKGAVVGRYVILGLVGRGGMGEVYAAFDPELDRKVAVKLLRGRAAGVDLEGRARLLREAQAIAKLSHPNVVVVYDVGTFQDSVFIAMEFIEGNTVGFWMQAAPRTWRDVLKVFLAAGRGLVAAHAAGIVHRDFKPENVMITTDGQVRVMDFGLARRVNEEAAPVMVLAPETSQRMRELARLGETEGGAIDPDATAKIGPGGAPVKLPVPSGSYLQQSLTVTGALVGTPAYMAPEQFAGEATSARTDQFSFCVALYEALYGQRPFEGDNVVALMANVVSGAIRDEPPATSVPARLRKVLLVGLAADPEGRHPSMAELLAALEAEPASRYRPWLAAAAAAALGAAAVLGIRQVTPRAAMCEGAGARLSGVWELGAASPRKETIRRAFEAHGGAHGAQLFASVSSLLDSYADKWAGMYREACEATAVRGEQSAEALDLRMACLGQRLGGVQALTDLFVTAEASVVENAVSAAGALPTLEGCADLQMLRSVIPPPDQRTRDRVEALRSEVAKARAMGDAGQCVQGLAAGRAALAAAKSVAYPPLEAEASYVVGRAGNYCLDAESAVAALEDAVWAAETSRDDEVAVEAASFAAGLLADRLHDVRAGRRWLRYADAILRRLPGHPILEAYHQVGWGAQLAAEGKPGDSVQEGLRGLAIKEQFLGPLHPDTAASAMNVGAALHELGRDLDAEPYAARAVDTFDRLLGPESAQGAMALLDHAEVLTALGRYADARRELGRAIAIWKKAEAGAYYVAYAELDLARVALAEKQPAEARALLEGAAGVLGKQDPQLGGQARFLLAQAMWETPRDRARAAVTAREAKQALVAASAPAPKVAELDAWLGSHAPP